MTKNHERINQLFEELVPASGKAENLAGELVRAMARIGYRWYNDGDQVGIGYGRETCNPAARFLIHKVKCYNKVYPKPASPSGAANLAKNARQTLKPKKIMTL